MNRESAGITKFHQSHTSGCDLNQFHHAGMEDQTDKTLIVEQNAMQMPPHLLKNVHIGLASPKNCQTDIQIVSKYYDYYHYLVDGINDTGWGCGYRTLQTMCSWVNLSTKIGKEKKLEVPSINTIQDILVKIGDKQPEFYGSKDWIGSFEIFLSLDYLYNISSKIVHIKRGGLDEQSIIFLKEHFENFKSPVMMGGDVDGASKCILGIAFIDRNSLSQEFTRDEIHLLVLDPHFVGNDATLKQLQDEHWISWKRLTDFDEQSFYNFCLPQISPDL